MPETVKEPGLPEKVSQLRQKLGQKAKQEPKFRFYVLYDRIFRMDVLEAAWERVRHNQGAPGVDGITIQQIVESDQGAAGLLEGLNRHLKGWANYFSFGYPLSVYCEIDRYVRDRLIQHLQRRSQRPYQPPKGEDWGKHLVRWGLIRLQGLVHA
jgi:hypothetical protein